MSKDILYNEEAREKLKSGIDQLANTVKITMGPKGRNVILEKANMDPIITNDGVTIAREIKLKDPGEDMGAQLIKEVARKTNFAAGDGTTTATMLAQSILNEALRNIASGADPMTLKRGVQGTTEVVTENLIKNSHPVETKEEMIQVASISAANREVGELVAEAMEKVEENGVVAIKPSKTMETTLEVVEGLQFDNGYLSAYMATDEEQSEAVLEDTYILITDQKISRIKDVVPLLEQVMKSGKKLLIIAENVEGEALSSMVINKMKGNLGLAAVKAPGMGDRKQLLLEDMALVTGGQVISEDKGMHLQDASIEMLGAAATAKVTKNKTVIIGGHGDGRKVEERKVALKELLDQATDSMDIEIYRERLAKLSGAAALVKVGAATEIEQVEKKMRIEDAISATQAAMEKGVSEGGGIALFKVIPQVREYVDGLEGDQKTGGEIVLRALEEPVRQIAENAGFEGSVIVGQVKKAKPGWGFNAETGDMVDMMASGIIDPTKVTQAAIENAASAAAILMTTEAGVTESVEEK